MSQRVDPERGSDSPVTVERSVDRKTEGVTVTYHFAALAGDTVGVRIVQPLAGDQAVRDVGFHPEHEPAAWTQSDAAVVFDAVVDGEGEIVLGVAGDRDRVLPDDANASVTAIERGVDGDTTDFLFGDPFPSSGWLGGVRRVLLGSDDANTPDVPIVDRDADDGAESRNDGITVEAANSDEDAVDWSALQPAVEPLDDRDDIVIEAVDGEHAEVTDADLADTDADTSDTEAEADADDVPPVEDVVVDAEATAAEPTLDDELVDAIERVDDTTETVDADAGTEAPLNSEPASEPEPERIDPTGNEPESVEPESESVETETSETAATEAEPVEPEPVDEPEPVEAESEPLELESETTAEGEVASESGAAEAASSTVEPELSEPPKSRESPEAADVAAQLAAELEAGDVEAETLDALREQLRSAEDATEVRLRHVQSRMSDFEAYADALEDVIEAHGTASPFMEETEARLDALDDEVAAAESRLEAEADAREDLDERVDDEVEAVEARVDEVDADVANLERNVEGVAGDVDELRASLTDVEREVAELRNTHETRFRRLEDDVNMLATDVRETREDLQTEVASLEDELEEMRSFRQTLSEAFDASGASNTSDGE